MVLAINEIDGDKNTCQMLAILITMQIWRCDVGHITHWSTSQASIEATGCRHWASVRTVSPWRLPWLTISNKTQNTNKTQLLAS
jgi:hypothetical protein